LSNGKKNGFKKTLFLNLQFLKMGKIGTYILKKKKFFADSHKKSLNCMGKIRKLPLKNFKIKILFGITEPAILFAPAILIAPTVVPCSLGIRQWDRDRERSSGVTGQVCILLKRGIFLFATTPEGP
jgi:hypothetical protein